MTFESPINNMRLYGVAKGDEEQDCQNQLSRRQFLYERMYFSAYDSLERKMYTDDAHRKRLEKISFGKRHANSYLGMDIIYRNRQRISKDSIELLYAAMDKPLQATTKGQALKIFVYGELSRKGSKFIDFTSQKVNGESFTLSAFAGQYILVSFWDAGCVPCRQENRKMSENHRLLDDKIKIVSFLLDRNKEAWIKAR